MAIASILEISAAILVVALAGGRMIVAPIRAQIRPRFHQPGRRRGRPQTR
jgi:hypothetical protein